jgi:glycosyltransferase involved in cell wall biosynthesis
MIQRTTSKDVSQSASSYPIVCSETLTIDIVIPSVRPRSELVTSLTTLRHPIDVAARFIIVVDRPGRDADAVRRAADRAENIVVIVNDFTRGASASRNRGIEAGTADYIVFLDDDVEPHEDLLVAYASAIRSDTKDHPGFVGSVTFPAPSTSFARGVFYSGVLTFFGLATQQRQMAWGVTANLCLRRRSLGRNRFSAQFPRRGGGEDIDLCLRVMKDSGGRAFLSVPGAMVRHPWWGDGHRGYRRFIRWAFGDSRLPALHPEARFINWPTMWETWLMLILFWSLVPSASSIVVVGVVCSVASEFVVDYAKLRRRGLVPSFLDAAESVLIRLSIDLGRILGNASRFRPSGFLEHFDFFYTGEHISYERRVAAIKTAIVLVTMVFATIQRFLVQA